MVELIPATDLECLPVDWLWSGWLARGKLHLLVGAPATGKTTLAMAVASALSRGVALSPAHEPLASGRVVIWSGEDDPADTLKPRLVAMGADPSQILFVGDRRVQGRRLVFDPARDMPDLQFAIERLGDVALLIVDPVVSVVQGDSHRNTDVRRSLQPLIDLAERTGVAVLGITHLAKGTAGRDPVERVIGSVGFAAAARVVWIAGKGPDSALLAQAKNNLASVDGGYRYAVTGAEISGIATSRIEWGGAVPGTARELLAGLDTDNEIGATALDEAVVWLEDRLRDGPVSSSDLKAAAEQDGLAWRTLERARRRLGIKPVRVGKGWGLAARPPRPPRTSES